MSALVVALKSSGIEADSASTQSASSFNSEAPQGWRPISFSEFLEFRNGVNAEKKAYGAGIPFVNVLEVITHIHLRIADVPGRVTLSESNADRYRIEYGDVLFNRTSETQEEVGLASVYLDSSNAVFGGFVIRGRPQHNHLDSMFAGYALRSRSVRSQIVAKGQGAIRANIGQRDLRKVIAILPPLKEQREIAAALSDVDALISGLDKLVAKKRAIKLAAVQQLLTGKTRLPGFRDPWKQTYLGEIAAIKTGKKNNQDKVEGGLYPFFVRSQTVERINTYSFTGEAILVPGEGGIGTSFTT